MLDLSPVALLPGAFHIPERSSDQPYLIGSRCRACGRVLFPKKAVCPACVEENTMEEVPLSRRGRLYSFTVAHVAPHGFKAPYLQAYIDLPEGPRIFSLVSNDVPPREDALEEGMEMELVIEPVGEAEGGRPIVSYKFRPAAPEGGGR